MPYTAIVLDSDSQNVCIEKAIALGVLPAGHPAKCHHVTLCMGDQGFVSALGGKRFMQVTHYGLTKGRVSAFRVTGADDSFNRVPHVTVAVFGAAKPVESNAIENWIAIAPFDIAGTVQICK